MADPSGLEMAVTLDDVRQAALRIAGAVRRTPLLRAAPLRQALPIAVELSVKLENLQVTGSFKARGAVNAVRGLPPDRVRRGLITASGGNHGLGVAYAGWLAGVPTTIYLPRNTPPTKARKLEEWGARVVVEGEVWDDANRAALAEADREGQTYVHPFADPAVIAGQGTVALEALADLPEADVLVVPIGGGGLMAGVALTAKALRPETRIVGVEPVGAPTLDVSLRAGHLVELSEITTAANTLAPRRSEELNFAIIRHLVDAVVLVDDAQMRAAARWLWFELGVAAELSGAAATAAVLAGKHDLVRGQRVCAIVSGAGSDGMT